MLIRSAGSSDIAAMLAIYAPFIEQTAVSFEEVVPSLDSFRDRVLTTMRTHPWLVAELDGAVAGFAYACEHRTRASYRWSTDTAVYVGERFRRGGVGRSLYLQLFDRLRAQNFVNAYAGITLPNDASVRLHERVGFEPVSIYERVGFKFGRWHDVGWWQLRLQEAEEPAEPRPPHAE